MPFLRILRCLPLPLLLAAAPAQQTASPPVQQAQPPSSAPPTTFHFTTREVLLDIVVTDRAGNPIPGLIPADFTVTEEGSPQVIRHLSWHAPMTPVQLAQLHTMPPLPPNTFTNYTPIADTNAATVILLDALDTPITAQQYLRQSLIRYFRRMPPGVPVAIFQLDTEMHLIQGFTTDPQVLLAAAQSKRDMPSLNKPARGTYGEYRRTAAR